MAKFVQTKVRISFDYYPDEPDANGDTGMSEREYNRMMDEIMALGGDDLEFMKVDPPK